MSCLKRPINLTVNLLFITPEPGSRTRPCHTERPRGREEEKREEREEEERLEREDTENGEGGRGEGLGEAKIEEEEGRKKGKRRKST